MLVRLGGVEGDVAPGRLPRFVVQSQGVATGVVRKIAGYCVTPNVVASSSRRILRPNRAFFGSWATIGPANLPDQSNRLGITDEITVTRGSATSGPCAGARVEVGEGRPPCRSRRDGTASGRLTEIGLGASRKIQ